MLLISEGEDFCCLFWQCCCCCFLLHLLHHSLKKVTLSDSLCVSLCALSFGLSPHYFFTFPSFTPPTKNSILHTFFFLKVILGLLCRISYLFMVLFFHPCLVWLPKKSQNANFLSLVFYACWKNGELLFFCMLSNPFY